MHRGAAERGQEPAFQVVNVDQAAAWNGDDGNDWVEHEEEYNASSARHTRRLIEGTGIAPTDRIVDIGCGCGESSRQAARAASRGSVLGVDLSGPMLARARERSAAEGLSNTRFEQGDAQIFPFEAGAFDLAMSRFGVMFFADPVAAFQNIRQALHSGGRMAFLCWQPLGRNEWMSSLMGVLAAGRDLPRPPVGSPGPFGLADPDATRGILVEAGFDAITIDAVEEPVTFGPDADRAFSFVSSLGVTRGMLRDLDEATKARALDGVRALIADHMTPGGVTFQSAAWLVTASRP